MLMYEMSRAINEARNTVRQADMLVGRMAALIAGRLQKGDVRPEVLAVLKKELRNFDMRTGQWRR